MGRRRPEPREPGLVLEILYWRPGDAAKPVLAGNTSEHGSLQTSRLPWSAGRLRVPD